jgi:hypothetical protein
MDNDMLLFFFVPALISVVVLFSTNYPFYYQSALAHIPTSNTSRIQEWTDSQNGINIQFMHEPERPIIDTFTELKFSVQNTTTGDHIKGNEDTTARIVVTNGQRLFRFENISVGNDGHFSVKYLFPDDGTHQAILRLDTKNSSTASSFNVFVPHQAPPSILDPFPSSSITTGSDSQQITMTVLLVGILGSIGVVTIFLIKRR